MTKINDRFQITALLAISAITVMFFVQLLAVPSVSAQTNHLANGISSYMDGQFDEALEEFRAEIEINSHCPLAYYYAAKIRITREQYSRAIQNLEAALRDSSDYYDANGLLAVTLLKSGFEPEALNEWNKFVNAVGIIDGRSAQSTDSIIMPEEYHTLLQQDTERKQREKELADKREQERLEAQKATSDSLEAIRLKQAENNAESSIEESNETASGSPPDSTGEENTAEEIDFPVEDLAMRIRTAIRSGIYAVIIASIILACIVIATVYIIRKRRNASEESNFSEEVERIINDREFELSEEKSIREFEAKKQELLKIVQSREKTPAEELPEEIESQEIEPEPVIQPKAEFKPQNVNNSNVTEEIKALVSKLHREGHQAEKIAQIADLSKTEVELILAVREHHMENVINDIHREDEDSIDSEQLVSAIHDLSAEGYSTREIAQKLSISISEVVLAYSIIEKHAKNSEL